MIVETQGSLQGMGATTRAGVAESDLFEQWKPSCMGGGWEPRVTDGDLFGVICSGAGTKVLITAHDRSSCISAVMVVAALQGYFVVGWIEESGGEDVRGIKAVGASLLGFTLGRSTHRSNVLQQGLLSVGSRKVNHIGPNSPFRPLGHTT